MSAKDAPRCLIVDDHPVVRAGVRALLERNWAKAQISDAATVEEALAARNGESPDVVIVDPWSAGAGISDVVGDLKGLEAPIVVFTSDGGSRLLSEALKAGVKGYVRKDSPSEDLIR